MSEKSEQTEALKLIEILDEIAIDYPDGESGHNHGLPTSDREAIARMVEAINSFGLSAIPNNEFCMAAFEAWAKPRGFNLDPRYEYPPLKYYKNADTQSAYEIWQACWDSHSHTETEIALTDLVNWWRGKMCLADNVSLDRIKEEFQLWVDKSNEDYDVARRLDDAEEAINQYQKEYAEARALLNFLRSELEGVESVNDLSHDFVEKLRNYLPEEK